MWTCRNVHIFNFYLSCDVIGYLDGNKIRFGSTNLAVLSFNSIGIFTIVQVVSVLRGEGSLPQTASLWEIPRQAQVNNLYPKKLNGCTHSSIIATFLKTITSDIKLQTVFPVALTWAMVHCPSCHLNRWHLTVWQLAVVHLAGLKEKKTGPIRICICLYVLTSHWWAGISRSTNQ